MGNAVTELVLEGLDCANCAAKIEKNVNELEGVHSARLNFLTKTLTIEAKDTNKIGQIVDRTVEIVNKLEPEVKVNEKVKAEALRKTYILKNLDCANCASKIEREIGSIPGLKSSSVDFVSRKLIMDIEDRRNTRDIIDKAEKIVARIEPDVEMLEEKENAAVPEAEDDLKKEIIKIGIAAVLYGIGMIFKFPPKIELLIFLASYIIVGGEVLLRAVKNIIRGQVFDENFLMAIATIGSFSIGQFPEGVSVMLFYQLGELFQDIAVNRSRKSITSLMDIRADYANLKWGSDIKRVSPEEVNIGDYIIIKPGERVPLDGIVVDGISAVDTSALTGESLPRDISEGKDILSGFINKNGVLTVKVTKAYGESTVAKILDLVQNAASRKAPTENFITKFARYYTPFVVVSALLIAVVPPLFINGAVFTDWLYRALIFLVISCPCALVISIPLGFFGGIGGASRNGVLVKGSNYLEALNNVETVVFDKTGTLTKGTFRVTEMVAENGFGKEELLEYAAYAEVYSSHPIAISIIKAYDRDINKNELADYSEIPGHGVKVKVKDKLVLAGNTKLFAGENVSFSEVDSIGTVVHVAVEGRYAGYIVISDEVKEDAKAAISELKNLGIKRTVMLTGDNKHAGSRIGETLKLDEVYSELLPHEKVEKLEMLDRQKSPKGKIIFVGDGVNDAPVLARADIGVAMGGLGSDAAIEAADVVLMTDEPSKLISAIKVAKRTKAIVWQNIVFALGVKLIVLVLGAGGVATMWEAVFADVGVAFIAILNSMRVMKIKNI